MVHLSELVFHFISVSIVRRKHLYYHRIFLLQPLHHACDLRQLDGHQSLSLPLLSLLPAALPVAGAVHLDPQGPVLQTQHRLVLQLGQLELLDLQLIRLLPSLQQTIKELRPSQLKIYLEDVLQPVFDDIFLRHLRLVHQDIGGGHLKTSSVSTSLYYF